MIITEEARVIWYNLTRLIKNPYGVAGVLGNLYAESALKANNLQNSYQKKLGMTDAQYTAAVDCGHYKDFATDGAGYGLAQWTYRSRKMNLEGFAKTLGRSIGDMYAQLNFLMLELVNYSYVLGVLRNAVSVSEASDAMYYMYEKPASSKSESSTAALTRARYAQEYYDELKDVISGEKFQYELSVLSNGSKGDDVKELQAHLLALGYDLGEHGADGIYGKATQEAVAALQKKCGVFSDGKAGAVTRYLASYLGTKARAYYKVTVSKLSKAEALELKMRYPSAVVAVVTE